MPQELAAASRIFLALWPTSDLLDALQANAEAWQWPAAARRTRPQRLHVTLHFLGSVEVARIDTLRRELAEIGWEGCELLLDRATVWPGGIAVLEATQVPPALSAFHARLGEAVQASGLALEQRRYRPHVTLARKAFGARAPAGMEPLPWRAGPQFALVRTLPGGGGYANLQCFG